MCCRNVPSWQCLPMVCCRPVEHYRRQDNMWHTCSSVAEYTCPTCSVMVGYQASGTQPSIACITCTAAAVCVAVQSKGSQWQHSCAKKSSLPQSHSNAYIRSLTFRVHYQDVWAQFNANRGHHYIASRALAHTALPHYHVLSSRDTIIYHHCTVICAATDNKVCRLCLLQQTCHD